MATYRTKEKKIVDALVEKLKDIDGNHPFLSNVFGNVKANMVFLDEIEEYPKCVWLQEMKLVNIFPITTSGDF